MTALWQRIPLAMAVVAALGVTTRGSEADETAKSEGLSLNPLSSLKPPDVSRFKDQPLFTPSRRPPPVTQPRSEAPLVVIAPPPNRAPPKVRLTGVVQGVTAPVAFLQRSDASTTSMVRVGDDVDGWLVMSIDPLGILLKSGAHQHEYKLFSQNPSAIDGPDIAATPKPERRINHPAVDLGANLRAKPQP